MTSIVHVEVSGLTGSGKSAVMGEIEIALKALGLKVEYGPDFQAEKNGTHADWQTALDLYQPTVVLSERNISRQPPAREDAQRVAWRCFHCDETFTDRRCAAAHFGGDEDAEPACKIKMGGERTMLDALRRAEKAAGDATFAMLNESTEAAQAYYAQQGRHAEQLTAAEQTGYERGLRDAQAHPETLGLTAATPPAPEAEKLRVALEWYGEQARLARLIHSEGDKGRQALADDGGKRARQALAALQQEGAK